MAAATKKAQQGSDDELRRNQPSRLGKPMFGASQNTGLQAGTSALVKPVSAAKAATAAAVTQTIKLVASTSNLKAAVAPKMLRNASSASTLKGVQVDVPVASTSAHPAVVMQSKRVEVHAKETHEEYMELPSINSECVLLSNDNFHSLTRP